VVVNVSSPSSFQVAVRFASMHRAVLIVISTLVHNEQEREGRVEDLLLNRDSWLAKTAADAKHSIDCVAPTVIPAFLRLCFGVQPEAGTSIRRTGVLFYLAQYNRKFEIQRQRL
jgi:hypothetical protein